MNDYRVQEIRSLLPRAMLADWVRLGSRLVRLLRDQHHAGRHDPVLDRLLDQARASVALRERRATSVPAVSYPLQLPITARKADIVSAIRDHQVLVLAGETGSGKTTQIPKMCLEAGLGIAAKIGCTQPRRVAALSISRRIAEELNVSWGREVGCKIRFDDHSSPETYVKIMTDGILLAETQGDPLLTEYDAIIVDEAHERSLNIDFLLGHLKGLLAKRPDLKLIITSATIETEAFSKAFGDAPIIEVSGRLFPVEVSYSPIDAESEETGDMTYVDAASRAAEMVLCEPGGGDVLIFMPGERDIRETCDLIRTRCGDAAEIIPLFGRLSSGDQQRVFAPADRRKVVVATNIAETSLTIPNIRYVIDSGLARISRYNPRTRIKRLPVEAISQSSANQRKGRSGRVRDGVCIRLYSEQDFLDRPAYTQPEIQRANLAEVILRMKAFRLGEIETFPFINPPTPAAIQAGYGLLEELGALDSSRELTPLGRDLAHLPIDPTLGRMLLRAQEEHATRELLIIASGLSIQDPRERPLEQKEAANAAHRAFADPRSDFLTLLNIWNAVHEQWEGLRTQNQRRKFCRARFLSYIRMREWQDLHAQLNEALESLGALRLNESNAGYEAIHRSILSGLLAHVAQREERNLYKGASGKKLVLFPGSALFAREAVKPRDRRGQKPGAPDDQAARNRQASSANPDWIVAGEIVETSQLFARTVAGIDPEWVATLGAHLCKLTHVNPHWSPENGRVLVQEVVTFRGLEVRRRNVAYANINPIEATDIFIRSALVEERLLPEPPALKREAATRGKLTTHDLMVSAQPEARRALPKIYKFIEENRAVRNKVETWQTRVRRHALGDLDEAMAAFYAKHISNVSSIHELNRFLGEHGPETLMVTAEELTGGCDLGYDAAAFPDAVPLAGQSVPLSYAYEPGEEQDGVTLQIGFSLSDVVSPAVLEWAIPGLREAQAAELLRSLPKAIRRQLMPLQPKAADIVKEFQPGGGSLTEDLGRFIRLKYGVEVPLSAWPADALPSHLRPRVEIVADDSRKIIGSGRDLAALRDKIQREKPPEKAPTPDPAWAEACHRWERFGLRSWSFGDLPEALQVNQTTTAFPGLALQDGEVNLRLFHALEAARRASLAGVRRLVELEIEKDLAWVQKDLRALDKLSPLSQGLCSTDDLQRTAMENVRKHVLPNRLLPALREAEFREAVNSARARIPGTAQNLIDVAGSILQLRIKVIQHTGTIGSGAGVKSGPKTLTDFKSLTTPVSTSRAANAGSTSHPATPKAMIAADLAELLPPNFLEVIPFERLTHIPRYLKAMVIRAERACVNSSKDVQKACQLAPFAQALKALAANPPRSDAAAALAEEFRWHLEEFKVSLFAQELGTLFTVSAPRLNALLEKIRMS